MLERQFLSFLDYGQTLPHLTTTKSHAYLNQLEKNSQYSFQKKNLNIIIIWDIFQIILVGNNS